MRGARSDAGGAVVALSHPAQIRQQGVLFADARPDRLPRKRQFPEGAAFYTTLLHEVTHSTGHAKRLNRPFGSCYGDADYIREELVAELTAALCGAMLGFATTPREESAAYIKDWLAEFHKEPTYLFDILTDVNRAARMISERLAVEQEPATPGAIPAEAA